MSRKLDVEISMQPDYTTCGPTSLHAVYQYWEDEISLEQTVKEIQQFDEGGGTLGVVLGKHALKRGYSVTIYSYNINIFDPTWFSFTPEKLIDVLEERASGRRGNTKDYYAIKEYIDFIKLGGEVRFQDLTKDLLFEILHEDIPILTGLSSTWLYQDARENAVTNEYDSIHGDPTGHFVIINGYKSRNEFFIADPYHKNPIANSHHYQINGDKLINSILLGISTYDGNLLAIKRNS